jgi:hypothetical protein
VAARLLIKQIMDVSAEARRRPFASRETGN